LSERLLPDRGGFTVRLAGKDITLQERTHLASKIAELENEIELMKCRRCEDRGYHLQSTVLADEDG
jgi:hypothetical protein